MRHSGSTPHLVTVREVRAGVQDEGGAAVSPVLHARMTAAWRRPRGGADTISTNQLPSSYLLLVYFIMTKYIVLNYLFIQLSKKLKTKKLKLWSCWDESMSSIVECWPGQQNILWGPRKIIFPKVKYRDQSFIPNIHFCYAQHCQVQGTVACKVTHAPESTISSPSSGERYLIYEFHWNYIVKLLLTLYIYIINIDVPCFKSRYLQPWCSIWSSHRWK